MEKGKYNILNFKLYYIIQGLRVSFIVAIDGPSCSGKSTIARILALELGFSHIQSGAIYRCIGLQMLNENIGITNEKNC